MKLIDCSTEATPDTFCKVDDEDFDSLNKWKWKANTKKAKKAIVHRISHPPRKLRREGKRSKTIYIHREIMKAPKGLVVDHIDGDTLNNQKSNLRICTQGENGRNRKKQTGKSSSAFKGVSKKNKSFCASIRCGKKNYYIGTFRDEIDAARAYNIYAVILHKEFAKLNEV